MRDEPQRPLGAWTALALGVNSIVGSGIYAFPSRLFERLGPLSVVAFAATAVACIPVALAYAELGRDTDRSGGTYRYAHAAFGSHVGAIVAWICWLTAIVSWAAVARAVPGYLGEIVPALGRGVGATAAAAALVVGLSLVNYRGVRMGAWVSNGLTIGKLLPLLLLAAAGALVPFVRSQSLTPLAPHGVAPLGGAVLLTLFAYQGFEVVGVPAGEMRRPKRDVPRAVLGSLGLATILYCAVQLAYVSAGAPGGNAPLAAAGRTLYGAWAGSLLTVGGLVSMVGFNAGTALGTPRYVSSLADDGGLPAALARRHARYGTPVAAIAWTGALTLAGVLFLDFERLVDLSNVSVLAQYVATSLALLWTRRRVGWAVVGVASCLVCAWMLAQARGVEVLGLAVVVLAGAIVLPLLRKLQ